MALSYAAIGLVWTKPIVVNGSVGFILLAAPFWIVAIGVWQRSDAVLPWARGLSMLAFFSSAFVLWWGLAFDSLAGTSAFVLVTTSVIAGLTLGPVHAGLVKQSSLATWATFLIWVALAEGSTIYVEWRRQVEVDVCREAIAVGPDVARLKRLAESSTGGTSFDGRPETQLVLYFRGGQTYFEHWDCKIVWHRGRLLSHRTSRMGPMGYY